MLILQVLSIRTLGKVLLEGSTALVALDRGDWGFVHNGIDGSLVGHLGDRVVES